MAWIDDDKNWWSTSETSLSAGRALYWLATVVAVLIASLAIVQFFISWAEGRPILAVFALITAMLVWLIGRICRILLP